MTGAESLLQTAVDAGIDTCFANPGTTEMDIVGALDATPEIRSVLGLFEGVCTGMADGYGRMTARPALTLLHLGVGLGNGIANLHNARRARTPIVNVVGDHPQSHIPYDAPLTSDIATMAKPVSSWVRTSATAAAAAPDMADAIAHAQGPPGRIATFIVPADSMRDEAGGPASLPMQASETRPDEDRIQAAVDILRKDDPVALLVGGSGLLEPGIFLTGRIASATGCRAICVPFPARLERGAGLPMLDRMPYFPEAVLEQLSEVRHLILVAAQAPVSFFKYRDYPSNLVPETCEPFTLCPPDVDPLPYLEALASALDAPENGAALTELKLPDPPSGPLATKTAGAAIAAALPENAIVADESATSGGSAYYLTRSARRHSALYLTGGGIGLGIPMATGAAVACPDRPVLALQGDGGAMYTFQALWTQAREGLNVTNVIFSNRKYQILNVELERAGLTDPGPIAQSLTDLTNPELNWCDLAKGMGVDACRPESAEALYKELQRGLNEPGPCLIEVVL